MFRYLRGPFWVFALIVLIAGCATRLPASYYPRTASYALQNTSGTELGRAYEPAAKRHPGESGFHLLPTGAEALMMRIALIESSQRSIDMQYFSTRDDTTGKLLLEAITRAAKRGVRVRMLLDDWNLDDFEDGAVALSTYPNIEIRVFNPYSSRDETFLAHMGNVFFDLNKFTHRMHNKTLIADNQIAIIGGRNIGDEYFDAGKEIDFRDIDIFASGPITRRISDNFDTYWNSNQSFPVSALNLPSPDPEDVAKLQQDMQAHWNAVRKSLAGKQLYELPLPRAVKQGKVPLIWAQADLVSDQPNKILQPSDEAVSLPQARIDQLVAKAQHEFIIFTPYFVPLDNGVNWLNGLVARGVSVRIITNSLASTDMVVAHAGYSHYREALVSGGVDLYEIKELPSLPNTKHKMFKPSSQNGLHSKIYMIDRQDLVIGSFNFDPRSVHINTEQVLAIHSPQLCAQIANLFAEVTSPDLSYRLIPADEVPEEEQPVLPTGNLAWVTRENGKTVYYDFNPHAGFWRGLTDRFFSLLPIDDEL